MTKQCGYAYFVRIDRLAHSFSCDKMLNAFYYLYLLVFRLNNVAMFSFFIILFLVLSFFS